MAARDDILEKVKKSRQQAEQRIQESNRQAQAEHQESQKTYQQNTSAETKKAASYMQDYSSQSRAGNTVAAYAEKRKRSTQWYKGSEPTEAETLAQILKKGEHDDNLGRELYGLYEQAKAEGHWAETYDKPTSQYLTALGIEDPSVINDEFINSLTPYLAAGVNTSTGGLSSAKKNGPEAMLAYNVGGLISDYQDTKELLAEQEQAAKEAQYWIAKGLTDDEIKEKLNIGGEGSKYTKLTSAINKTSTGGVVPTTAPIPLATSYGVDGMLYALRNPDSSKGDFLLDAVQKELGRGVQAQDNPAAKARRTPGSETWNPYINGTTMDDEGIRFGTTQFDKGWLDANRQAILSNGNEDDVKAFTRIYNAEERTAAAESELSDLTSSIEMQLQADPTQDADALIVSIFGSSDDPTYKTLAAMDESLLSGAVLDMTRGVAYDRKSIEKYIRDYVADAQLREQATVDPAAMDTVVEQDKAAAAEENGGSLITAGSFLESVPAAVQKSVFGETVDPEMMIEGWTWILNGAKGLFKKNKQEEETAPAETTEETPEGSAQAPAEPIAVVASAGMSDVRPQAPKTDAETQEFLDKWFDGKIPTDDEFAEKYDAVLNDPSVPDADVKYFFERGTEIVGKAQDDVENYQQEVDIAQQTTSDIAEAGTKHLTAEEAQTATVLMNDFIENGQYADAAALQFSVLTSAVTDSNDQYVRELVTSVGGQEAAVQLANLVLQGDMVSQVNDPSVREALTQYENYIWAALDADEESKLTFAKALDFVSGGAVSDTADNEGVGLFQMLKSTFVKGASGINDSWANLVGAAMTGYGHAVKGTNWIVNNTLGKVFGFQLNDSAAEATIQAGQDVSSYYDKIGANEDAYLRENASTLEYFVATAGGEAIKMGAQSFAGSAIGGRFTDTVGKIMNKGGLRQLTTAMDLSKVEGLMSKVVSASPFIADSFGNEYQDAYSETQNPATATLSALVSAFSTTALMNMDAIKNIENMGGKLIPELVDAIKAIPGASLTASFKRFGKAGMMYIGNMLKTAANEAIQEPTENLLTTWATDAIKGKSFFDRDMKAFGQELAQDAFYAAIGTFGNSMASLPSWSRSAIYADQMMGKTGLTMQEVQGQIDAFIADMNDPQVVAQTQANLTAAAEQYVTGELLQQGALGEVNAQPVLKAQEKLDAATISLNETVKNMQIVSEQRDTASARFAENPADPKATSNMLAAVDAYNKAAQETEAAQAVQAEAQAKLDEASAALKEQTDTAMQAVRAKATVLVEQHVSAASKTNRLDAEETEVYNVGESGGYGNGEEYREYDGRGSSGSDAEGRRGSSKNDRLDSRTAIEGWAPTSKDREEAPGVITRASKGYEAFEKAVKNSGLRYDDGEPIILYHGTRNDFEMMGRMDLTDGPQNYDTSHGIYLTNDINVANLYSFMYGNFEGRQAIHPVALNTDKIARFDADGFGQDPDYQNYVALLIERYNKYAGKENFAQNLEKALARELAEMNIEDHIANLIKSEFERLGKIDAIEVAGAAWNFNDGYVDDQYIVFDPSLLVPATEAYWAEQGQEGKDNSSNGGSQNISPSEAAISVLSSDGGDVSLNAAPVNTESSEFVANPSQDIGNNGSGIVPPGGEGGAQQPSGRTGKRQFANQTLQNSDAMPEWLKQELRNNPAESDYEVDSNYQQAERAWNTIQQNGYEQERDRLINLERFSPDDTAEANLLMAMANHNGDAETLLSIASAYNREGTKAGQELQARKLFSKMSPTGAKAFVAGQAETRLKEFLSTNKVRRDRLNASAENITQQLLALPDTELSSDNRWGVELNGQQQELIRHYHLENVARPGLHYNRATTKQRMLEAIIATPAPMAMTGNGLNLVQRLEYMDDGLAVVTNADLDYIGTQLAQFVGLGGEVGGRDADLAVSRAYEAFGNITPATAREKMRTWRYTSMLLSVPSAIRNVIGNTAQNLENATAHGVASMVDRVMAQITGERTVANINMQERIDGWRGFVDETKNTFRDYFVDQSITQRGEAKYDTHQRGRVYQSPTVETMRNLEGFLMSIGDRNFWRKAYLNSIAEQQRLAELNGTTLTMEEMESRAEADANYATFTEDSKVRDALSSLKQIPGLGDVLDFILPFTGVPINITKRMWQYSPFGLAGTLLNSGYQAAVRKGAKSEAVQGTKIGRKLTRNAKDFDQRAFVMSVSRGLTGTALFGVGMALAKMGAIKLGTGDEEDAKKYGLRSAMGEQYTPYVYNPFTDEYVSLAAFAPAVSPLIMGATAADIFAEDENTWMAIQNAALASIDQIFDASFMSGLSDLFSSNGSPGEKVANAIFTNAVSQSVPALFSQLSAAIDPYVRDTKDKNWIMQALKAGLISRIPGLRQMLPEKVDVTGQTVRTKEGWRNFFDPFTTTDVNDDPALQELIRLSDDTGETSFLPSDALSGSKMTLRVSGQDVTLDGHQKETYKKRYGQLWLEGGTTINKKGQAVSVMGVRAFMNTPTYQSMTDEERTKQIQKIVKAAKEGASMEMLNEIGPDPEGE